MFVAAGIHAFVLLASCGQDLRSQRILMSGTSCKLRGPPCVYVALDIIQDVHGHSVQECLFDLGGGEDINLSLIRFVITYRTCDYNDFHDTIL